MYGIEFHGFKARLITLKQIYMPFIYQPLIRIFLCIKLYFYTRLTNLGLNIPEKQPHNKNKTTIIGHSI